MTEQFRNVENLERSSIIARTPALHPNRAYIALHYYLTVPEARALRDWLNRALPEENTHE